MEPSQPATLTLTSGRGREAREKGAADIGGGGVVGGIGVVGVDPWREA